MSGFFKKNFVEKIFGTVEPRYIEPSRESLKRIPYRKFVTKNLILNEFVIFWCQLLKFVTSKFVIKRIKRTKRKK